MDATELKKMMAQMASYMARHGLQRMKIKSGDVELELEKPALASAVAPALTSPLSPASPANPAAALPTAEASKGYLLTSPIVGTFYNASAPGAAPFVKMGDQVQADSVVCIIEAMKVMNEVRAGQSGTIAEILIENGHPVEFGTKILRIV